MGTEQVLRFLLPTALWFLTACSVGVREALPTRMPTAVAITALAEVPSPDMTPAAVVALEPNATATSEFIPTQTARPTATRAGCDQVGTMILGQFPSQIAGPTRPLRVYLPPCYGEDSFSYPTLYIFHGNIHTDSKWDELGLDEAADKAILGGELPPMLIVMPDGGAIANNTSGGPTSFEGVVINELVPYIEERFCAWPDPAGRAIGGLSRGGYWALEIAFRHPGLFASVGGHSAALLDIAAGPDLNPQHTGLSNDLGDLRIYLDIGSADYVIGNIRLLHENMTTSGIPHDWVLNEGGHEDAYWAGHLEEYLNWYAKPWPHERASYPACASETLSPVTMD